MENLKNRLGRWLEDKCREEKLSLREAAGKSGLSHATISDLMKGSQASAETIKKLATAFSGDGHHQRALEDKLLILAGYRSEPLSKELSEPMARLVDRLSGFSESQIRILGRFADFIDEMEKK